MNKKTHLINYIFEYVIIFIILYFMQLFYNILILCKNLLANIN